MLFTYQNDVALNWLFTCECQSGDGVAYLSASLDALDGEPSIPSIVSPVKREDCRGAIGELSLDRDLFASGDLVVVDMQQFCEVPDARIRIDDVLLEHGASQG